MGSFGGRVFVIMVSSTDNIIDSREVIDRIEELEATDIDNPNDPENPTYGDCTDEELKELAKTDYQAEELIALREFAEEAEQYSPDWRYGETLIADGYFEQYARELAEDLGWLKDYDRWPGSHIDWSAAADELKHDYADVYFEGEQFWIRCG